MSLLLVYVGSDHCFEAALQFSAQALGVAYKALPVSETSSICDLKDPALLIVDAEYLEDASAIAREMDRAAETLLPILAASEESGDIAVKGRGSFKDILVKNMDKVFLINKLGLYIDHLSLLVGAERAGSEVIEENSALRLEVISLQGQLDRFDSDLQIQEAVISKINQISHLSRQINCLNLKQVALVCIERIPELISARFASLYAYDEQRGVLELLRHNHPYTIEREVVLREHPESPMAIAVRQKRTLLVKDLADWAESEEICVSRQFIRNYKSNSCIITPVQSGGKIAGLLNLADKIDESCFDHTRDMPPVELLCEIIGSAMSNIKLYEEVRKQARTDGMTGLVNHTTFYDELDKEVNRSRRYGGNLSLIMIDLDNLKQINDEYGHRAGDAMLCHVSEKILHCVRGTDIPARYGGDEFAIILPNTSLSDALIVAQRLLEMVSEHPIYTTRQELNVSVSIGLGQYQADLSTEGFMRDSDGALLDAKNSGKNRIHISETVNQ